MRGHPIESDFTPLHNIDPNDDGCLATGDRNLSELSPRPPNCAAPNRSQIRDGLSGRNGSEESRTIVCLPLRRPPPKHSSAYKCTWDHRKEHLTREIVHLATSLIY
ncbi:hypothetical protein CDAR_206581 [Caerostris darwini]|uniref:Uncharacterized protein n=1 Tax=Caerostris darwini TaxID=1538125 RepID=A0AAV4S6T4_9ARAC|nr:hypothetical protein CDAR_206581 [Caerostris darwini]